MEFLPYLEKNFVPISQTILKLFMIGVSTLKKEAATAKKHNNWHLWSWFENVFENLGGFGKKDIISYSILLLLLVVLYVHSGLIPNTSSPKSPWLTEMQNNFSKGEVF